MKMKRVFAALVAGAAMLFAPALMAQDAPAAPKPEDKPAEKAKEPEKAPEGDKETPKEGDKKDGEKKEEGSPFDALFKELSEVTGKVEFNEADVKAFIKNYPELDKLTDADPKFKKLADKSLKEAFDYLVKDEKYLAWAKAKEVDADKYLRVTLRIVTTSMKAGSKGAFKEAEEQIEAGAKQLEGVKDVVGEEEYKKAIEEIAKAKKDIAAMRKAMDGIPGPTEAEAKLLEANKKEISKAMGEGEVDSDDADADDEKEDGMGGK